MNMTQYDGGVEGDGDESRVSTPIASSYQPNLAGDQGSVLSFPSVPGGSNDDIRAISASFASELDTRLHLNDETSAHPSESHPNPPNGHIVLPLPTPSVARAQSTYVLPDVRGDDAVVNLSDLPSEIATADISLARECASCVRAFAR